MYVLYTVGSVFAGTSAYYPLSEDSKFPPINIHPRIYILNILICCILNVLICLYIYYSHTHVYAYHCMMVETSFHILQYAILYSTYACILIILILLYMCIYVYLPRLCICTCIHTLYTYMLVYFLFILMCICLYMYMYAGRNLIFRPWQADFILLRSPTRL